MATHGVEIYTVAYVFVRFKRQGLLKLEFGVHGPHLDKGIGRGSCQIRAVRVNLPRHRVKLNVNYAICVTFQLTAQLAVWNAP